MLVEKIKGSIDNYDVKDRDLDMIILDHEELTKPHQRTKTQAGRDVAISLPVGAGLFYGAVLYEDKNLVIYVEMADEELLEIYPADNIEWGRAAFNIGNMHHAVYLRENSMITPYDPAIERIFQALNIKYEKKTGKLKGIRANVNQTKAHADHNHDHSHKEHRHE